MLAETGTVRTEEGINREWEGKCSQVRDSASGGTRDVSRGRGELGVGAAEFTREVISTRVPSAEARDNELN